MNNILKHNLIFLCLRAQIVVVMEVRVEALVEALIVDMVVREEASEETAEEVDWLATEEVGEVVAVLVAVVAPENQPIQLVRKQTLSWPLAGYV